MQSTLAALTLLLLVSPALAAGDPEQGTAFDPAPSYDARFITTALSANWHMRTVSLEGEAQVRQALSAAGWHLQGEIIQPKGVKDGRAYVALQGDDLVIAFRGSGGERWWETGSNALTDANARKERPDWLKAHAADVRVHKGFSNEYQRFREQILPLVRRHTGKRIFVVGFSLGGALAQLCALDLSLNTDAKRVYAYPHASPRVGEKDFRELIEARLGRLDRVALDGDPVPRLPPKALAFKHAGRLLLLDPEGNRKAGWEEKVKLGYHDYDKYHTALQRHLALCPEQCQAGSLWAAAEATR